MPRTFISSRHLALSTLTGPRSRGLRRRIGRSMQKIGRAIFWIARLPLAIGRSLMWLGGRLQGYGFEVGRDR